MADVAFSRQTWLFQLKCRLFRFKCCYFCWNVGTIFALFVQSRPMLTKTLAIFLARKRATLGSKFSQFSPPQSSKSAKCQFLHKKIHLIHTWSLHVMRLLMPHDPLHFLDYEIASSQQNSTCHGVWHEQVFGESFVQKGATSRKKSRERHFVLKFTWFKTWFPYQL